MKTQMTLKSFYGNICFFLALASTSCTIVIIARPNWFPRDLAAEEMGLLPLFRMIAEFSGDYILGVAFLASVAVAVFRVIYLEYRYRSYKGKYLIIWLLALLPIIWIPSYVFVVWTFTLASAFLYYAAEK